MVMSTDNLEWFEGLFATVDNMDSGGFVSYLTEDASFVMGSQPAVKGREAIAASTSGFFGTLKGIGHNLIRTWVSGDTRICQGEVTYDLSDGRSVTMPFVNVFVMEGDLIQEYLVYVDPTPMMA